MPPPIYQENPYPESPVNYRVEALFGLIYFTAYLAYLFFRLEGEWLHWLSLVILPLGLLYLYQKKQVSERRLRDTLASVGARKDNWRRGLGWAVVLGLIFSVLQLFLSRRVEAIWPILESGKVLYLFPMAFVLLMLTAGFTEEFFFRGVLQTRLTKSLKSKVWGVVVAAVLFGLYHLPYAYLHPNWPSHGDWGAAFGAALGQGVPMGLILGAVYEATDRNVFACVVIHALNNTLPAMTMIKMGGSG